MYRTNIDSSVRWSFIAIQLLHCSLFIDASFLFRELPCTYIDSIDISGGVFHANRSIVFNNMEFLENQYAEVNYILQNGISPIIVKPYYRGCPCNIKPCVRLCCPYGSFVQSIRRDGNFTCYKDNAAQNVNSEIINEFNETKVVRLHQQFGFINKICKYHYFGDGFKLTDKGFVLFDNEFIDHREYCLKITNDTEIEAMICLENGPEYHIKYRILPYTMMISIPPIFVTFLVYVCIPELTNLLGKCLLCYLSSLFVYYIALSYIYLNAGINIPPQPCKILAYLIYLAYFSGSLWLNAISLDLWLSFRSTVRYNAHSDRKLFRIYSCYVWIIAIVLTTTAGMIDTVDSIPDYLKPGFGIENCFIKEQRLSKFLFFHMPIAFIFIVNIVFFILTAVKIRRVQRELNTYFHSKDSSGRHQVNFDNKKYNFTLFLRLFIVMGITWSVDAICFVSPGSTFFFISDICNALHGVFICILFVLKRRVLNLIKQRCKKMFDGVELKSGSSISATSTYRTNEIRMQEVSSNKVEQI